MTLQHTIEREARIAENVRLGVSCPCCGGYDISSVAEVTGQRISGEEALGCADCGCIEAASAFQALEPIRLDLVAELSF